MKFAKGNYSSHQWSSNALCLNYAMYYWFLPCRIVPPDERVQRYERAVVMSVYGLSLALQRLEGEELAERQSIWEPLLGGKKLWKLARHQNPYVSGGGGGVCGASGVVCGRTLRVTDE